MLRHSSTLPRVRSVRDEPQWLVSRLTQLVPGWGYHWVSWEKKQRTGLRNRGIKSGKTMKNLCPCGLQFDQHTLRDKKNQYFVKCNLPAMDEKIPNILYIVTHYDVQVAALSSTSQLVFFCGQNMGLQKCSHRNNESASIQKTKSAPCCSKFLSKLAACGKYHPKPNKRRDDGAWLWDIHQPTASSFSRPRISTCGILDQVGSLLWAIFSSKQA